MYIPLGNTRLGSDAPLYVHTKMYRLTRGRRGLPPERNGLLEIPVPKEGYDARTMGHHFQGALRHQGTVDLAQHLVS